MTKTLSLTLVISVLTMLSACTQQGVASQATPTSTLRMAVQARQVTATLAPALPSTPGPIGPTATPFAHIVQQGETLLGIAIRYGVTLDNLLLVNPGVDPRILSVGQQIAIPGPSGEPIDLLLPTPTAVPIQLFPVRCFQVSTGDLRCLVQLKNDQSNAVEGVGLTIFLFNMEGTLLDQANVNTLTRYVQPGDVSTLDAQFSTQSKPPHSAIAQLTSAVQVLNLEERLIPANLKDLEIERNDSDQLITFQGEVVIDDAQVQNASSVTIQAFGYNAEGEPIASNAFQVLIADQDFPIPFSFSLFSLESAIVDFDLVVEVLRD